MPSTETGIGEKKQFGMKNKTSFSLSSDRVSNSIFIYKISDYNHAQSTDLEEYIFLGTKNFTQLQIHEKLCPYYRVRSKLVFYPISVKISR